MVSRLALGTGAVSRRIVDALAGRAGPLSVIDDDEGRVETLREEGVDARVGDPADPGSIVETGVDASVVLVLDDDPTRNVDLLRAVRRALPEATLIGYHGRQASARQRRTIDRLAERTIDPTVATADDVLDTVAGHEGDRTMRLRRTLSSIDGQLAVVTHDNPDPDAIGSAVALAAIAKHLGVEATPCYFGEITHQQNRAFVNVLDLDLRKLADRSAIDEFGGVALVDHSRPGVNDQLSEDTPIDIVIDHHPPRAPIAARYVDLRSDVGATSTLVTGYVQRFGVPADGTVATALLYGIRVDTKEFSREVSRMDFDAAAFLSPHADHEVLERVETPTMAPDTLDTIARAIVNRRLSGNVLTSCVGTLNHRDALSQAVDRLLTIEDVTTALVYGISDEVVYVSARARGTDVDIGETLRTAFDRIGSAGGHVDMAGAQIPIGAIVEEDADESTQAIVEEVITDRFYEAFQSRPPEIVEYDGIGDDPYPLYGEGEQVDDEDRDVLAEHGRRRPEDDERRTPGNEAEDGADR